MRWVLYLLVVLNAFVFAAFLFVAVPSDGFSLVQPAPIARQGGGESVLLLKESTIGETSEESVDTTNPATETSLAGVSESFSQNLTDESPKCYKLGPFSSKIDADSFHARVGMSKGAWIIDGEVDEGSKLYWTHIPPLPTMDAALSTLRSLQMQGIDSYVLSGGTYANAVSLGTFKKQDSAEALRDRVAELGFDAQVTTKQDAKNKYWLYLQVAFAGDQVRIETIAEDGVQARVFSCEIFAQGTLLP